MYLIFDTETTGLPLNYGAPAEDLDNWPRLVQLAWQLHDARGGLIEHGQVIVKPDGFDIPFDAQQVHKISTERAASVGEDLGVVLARFLAVCQKTSYVVGHNLDFDIAIIRAECLRKQTKDPLKTIDRKDTMRLSTDYVGIPSPRGGFKWPSLEELHKKLFNQGFSGAHHAAFDVHATARSFFELLLREVIPCEKDTKPQDIVYEAPSDLEHIATKPTQGTQKTQTKSRKSTLDSKKIGFCHLHVHSQFSILPATLTPQRIVSEAHKKGMSAIAITDLGNLCGAFTFVEAAKTHKLKPIIGCGLYISARRKETRFTRESPDIMYAQVFLAKNKTGYHNLASLSSLGYAEGLYGLYPRVDKALIQKYKEGLIALSGGLQGELSRLILSQGPKAAEKSLLWWQEQFQDDFYLELVRHGHQEEDHVNEVFLRWAKTYGIKYVACNEVFYADKQDAYTHDTLCLLYTSDAADE